MRIGTWDIFAFMQAAAAIEQYIVYMPVSKYFARTRQSPRAALQHQ